MNVSGKEFKDLAVAASLSWSWFGMSKVVEGQVQEELTESLETHKKAVRSSKGLFDPKTEEVRALGSIKTQATRFWVDHTLPYLEQGVRLSRKDQWLSLKADMLEWREKLKKAEKALQDNKVEVIEKARVFLGPKLFNPSDYPESFVGSFGFAVEVENVDPPSYLMELDPEEFKRQQDKLAEKMEAALNLFEEQCHTGLSDLLNKLVEKMRPGEDGKKKVFHESTFTNLLEFFEKYKNLRVRDNPALDELVKDAQEKIKDFDVGAIRASEKVRDQVLKSFQGLAEEASKHVTTIAKRKVKVGSEEENVTEEVPESVA